MGRKREKPYFSRHHDTNPSPSLSKRLRPMPTTSSSEPDASSLLLDQQQSNRPTNHNSSMVVITNLPHDCSVLKLKSRFEMYGSVSRLRIEDGVGYVTFRSKDSAEAAVAASLDPFLGIIVESEKVVVSWPNDDLPGWREGVASLDKDSPTSKLLRPEVPLRKHGRGNKLSTTSRNPRNILDLPFKGREIVAYDDLL